MKIERYEIDYELYARKLALELQSMILCTRLYRRNNEIERKMQKSAQALLDEFRSERNKITVWIEDEAGTI